MVIKKVILFDFDGVIVDSTKLSYGINKQTVPDLEYSEWQSWFEGNVYKNIRQELAGDDYQNKFFNEYNSGIVNLIPVEGIEKVIDVLSAEFELVIVSSASEEPIKNFLKLHRIDHKFSWILGRETHRNKVEKFRMVLDKYGIKPEETLIITDTVGDIKEAHHVGIKTLAVVWGVHDKEMLLQHDPHFIAHTPGEIIKGIEHILGK